MVAERLERFRADIATLVGVHVDHVSVFGRGRVALYAILRALGIGEGDEVILPAFTCVAVPNAVLYTGARPVFVDIDEATLTIDPAAVERAIGPRTRAVLAQNTFGLGADLPALQAVVEASRVTIVDDCTHGLGGTTDGRPNGSIATASFFSTQWSKPLSTGLGGFAVTTDPGLARRLAELEASAVHPSRSATLALRVLVAGASRAGDGGVFRAGRAAYRTLSRAGLLPASSAGSELAGPRMPDGFVKGMSEWQAAEGSSRIPSLPAAVRARRETAERYSNVLRDLGRTAPVDPIDRPHSFLRFPVRLRNRVRGRRLAEDRGIDLGDWFVSPLHPVTEHLDRWGYRPGTAPIAERVCAEIVNLPLVDVRSPAADRVVEWLHAVTEDLR